MHMHSLQKVLEYYRYTYTDAIVHTCMLVNQIVEIYCITPKPEGHMS